MNNMNFNFLGKYYPYYLYGAGITILISFFVVLLGLIIGTGIALMKLSKIKPINYIANIYITIFRGTPMLVQILIGFVLINIDLGTYKFGILSIDTSRLIPGIIVIGLNSGAYIAEIVRAGINSIDIGQKEAAYSLGLNPVQTMQHIIFPQALRNILPALGNEFITIIKDSSLLSTIGIMELLNGAQKVLSITYQPLSPLLVAAVFYLFMTFITSKLLNLYEKRLNRAFR